MLGINFRQQVRFSSRNTMVLRSTRFLIERSEPPLLDYVPKTALEMVRRPSEVVSWIRNLSSTITACWKLKDHVGGWSRTMPWRFAKKGYRIYYKLNDAIARGNLPAIRKYTSTPVYMRLAHECEERLKNGPERMYHYQIADAKHSIVSMVAQESGNVFSAQLAVRVRGQQKAFITDKETGDLLAGSMDPTPVDEVLYLQYFTDGRSSDKPMRWRVTNKVPMETLQERARLGLLTTTKTDEKK